MRELGTYLYKVRQMRGGRGHWSMRAVADRVGISHPYLSNLEKGIAKKPSPEVLKRIAEVLEVPQKELFENAGYIDKTIQPATDHVSVRIRFLCTGTKLKDINSEQRFVTLDTSITDNEDCFVVAINQNCDHLQKIGLYAGDLLIVKSTADAESGNMVIIKNKNSTTISRIFIKDDVYILTSLSDDEPTIAKKSDEIQILGKVVKAIKHF